ncbi:Alpha-amylase [Moritella viscosa]|uniref:Alpha-amylase n=1 Tax=Moritella viscosa TaxID=80854 RepID=A0A090ICU8_9GAMM|nr:alpha-amylase [Moritella viscosa]CED60050.1 alpha-amylase [Moritella viscosa]SGZ14333.1 Alpha-amylase [Moritella viscosa]SHO13923.1 Alpha-amylase [Moritella viscosa]SHO13925.1 Alpha-amylase [Moritella viscosa]SHO15121.1 Alpha-amylase [Moritella viscosa]
MKLNKISLVLMLVSPSLFASPNLTISTSTTSRDFLLTSESPLVVPLTKASYTLNVTGIEGSCIKPKEQKVRFSQPLALNCDSPTELPIKIRFNGDYAFIFDAENKTLLIKRQPKKSTDKAFKRPLPQVQCDVYKGGEVTINLADTYKDGTQLKDKLSGQVVTVIQQQVTITPAINSGGLILLEPLKGQLKEAKFNWRNANIYFVMIDRFNNQDTSNDNSYGRSKDGKDEVGTFHGGDLKGVIEKLDYIKSLGTSAIWLSPIVEQVRGFVGGGNAGSFPFYSYHGYWARDFTKIDANFGNENDLKRLVEEAHKRGIKVLLDVVINHPGYATLTDLQCDQIPVVTPSQSWPAQWSDWQPIAGRNWHSFNDNIDYDNAAWSQWWGGDWVRASLPNYPKPGSNDLTLSLAGLPDFVTESTKSVTPPQWLLNNPGTRVISRDNYTVADYLIEWQTDWVKRFGIDGYRIDTVKHVSGDVWMRLKQAATKSLNDWREANDETGQPFWMMGEVWGHSAYRGPYYDDGFDALLNFDMQKKMDEGALCFSKMADTYQHYADTLKEKPDFNPVSYMSSHDTELFFGRFKSFEMQRNAASALLLSPGAVQVYYGDEVARNIGAYADDFHQGTRSDMNWSLDANRQQLLKHWQTLGQFRLAHPAIGAGTHKEIKQQKGYAFSRTLGDDKVVVVFVGKQGTDTLK